MTGFVIVDLDGATAADGVVRCAKKILMDGARTMARSRSYSWALLGEQRSGASAAINVAPPDRVAGIAAFVDAVMPRVATGELSIDAGKGVGQSELRALQEVDGRSQLRVQARTGGTLADELTATSAVTAAAVALGGLEGRTVAIEGAGTLGPALLEALAAAGAHVVAIGTSSGTLVDQAGLDPVTITSSWAEHGESLPGANGSELGADEVLRTPADLVLCGSKLGLVDHAVAAGLQTQVLAPIGIAPITAKGLAVAARAGVIVLADFLTLSGGLHTFVADPTTTPDDLVGSVTARTTEVTRAALDHEDGAYLGACALAEQFLSTWTDELPFGRPLA